MKSQPQNPEIRNNPENFHPCSLCSVSYLIRYIFTGIGSLVTTYLSNFPGCVDDFPTKVKFNSFNLVYE